MTCARVRIIVRCERSWCRWQKSCERRSRCPSTTRCWSSAMRRRPCRWQCARPPSLLASLPRCVRKASAICASSIKVCCRRRTCRATSPAFLTWPARSRPMAWPPMLLVYTTSTPYTPIFSLFLSCFFLKKKNPHIIVVIIFRKKKFIVQSWWLLMKKKM